jgi:hypothetical protein
MICKCGTEMQQINKAWLPATYKFYWVCPLRHWWNCWRHTKDTFNCN